ADLRARKGAFAAYPKDEKLTLVGIIDCPGCPTLTGPDKLLDRIRGLTEFDVDVIHMTFCMKALCPFTARYVSALNEAYPGIRVVPGTHEEHQTPEEYRQRIRKLFNQEKRSMVDVILKRDGG
ncbi:MAG: CGGC domain-containing protein, partial [Deltaproteobacteria bacterium]|nr:CGGC domain-containing protein [Deltaproteobacteria bacterium]